MVVDVADLIGHIENLILCGVRAQLRGCSTDALFLAGDSVHQCHTKYKSGINEQI